MLKANFIESFLQLKVKAVESEKSKGLLVSVKCLITRHRVQVSDILETQLNNSFL